MFDTFINLRTLFRPYTQSDSLVGKIDFFYGDRSDESDFSLKVYTITRCRAVLSRSLALDCLLECNNTVPTK